MGFEYCDVFLQSEKIIQSVLYFILSELNRGLMKVLFTYLKMLVGKNHRKQTFASMLWTKLRTNYPSGKVVTKLQSSRMGLDRALVSLSYTTRLDHQVHED